MYIYIYICRSICINTCVNIHKTISINMSANLAFSLTRVLLSGISELQQFLSQIFKIKLRLKL